MGHYFCCRIWLGRRSRIQTFEIDQDIDVDEIRHLIDDTDEIDTETI
jgi:hypothetical protein